MVERTTSFSDQYAWCQFTGFGKTDSDLLAAQLGIDSKDLKSDLMGDIRQIRIAIIHHGGIAKKDIEKCKILKWFKAR